MKTILISLILFAAGSLTAQDWHWLNPKPQGNHLNAVSAFDLDLIMSVGDCGTMLKSGDGGSSWMNCSVMISENFHDVFLVNGNIAYAVGNEGICYKSTDGGGSWISLNTGT